MKRFLITTALEDTWRYDEPILFLGEWCRLQTRKVQWSAMNADVMPYHWDNRKKLYSDYQYLQDLYERLLCDLSKRLNEIHGVNYGLRYWRILVGIWLGYFTQTLFDRWESIQRAAREYELIDTIVLPKGDQANLVPNDMNDFNRLFHDDYWNHYIYAEILRNYTKISCTSLKVNKSRAAGLPLNLTSSRNFLQHLKKRTVLVLLTLYSKLSSLLIRSCDALIASTYLGHFNELRLQLRLKQFPLIYRPVKPTRRMFDGSLRKWSLEGESCSIFEDFVRKMVPKQIPILFLEGYHELIKQADSQTWPINPKFIWTSNAFSSDEVFKAYAAKKTEAGTPLIIGQHGGHYGVGKWNFSEEHELEISDYYLSWGWVDSSNKKIKAIGMFKPIKFSQRDRSSIYRATLVTGALQRYSCSMMSSFMSSQYLEYLDDQFAFVANLPKAIKQNLIIRLFPQDSGWSQAARWAENCPNIQLDMSDSDIRKLMAESKIYICTYNATTYLESLSINVPTVIFWNPNHWELRDSAIPYFNELKSVGIFHESPISAAEHCSVIWDDIDAWWLSADVQSIVKKFCHQFAHRPANIVSKIDTFLQDAVLEIQNN